MFLPLWVVKDILGDADLSAHCKINLIIIAEYDQAFPDDGNWTEKRQLRIRNESVDDGDPWPRAGSGCRIIPEYKSSVGCLKDTKY